MTLEPGQVYRKAGPRDWCKITRVLIPGYPDYDGALPGVSVRFSNSGGKGWNKAGWFIACKTEQQFLECMKLDCRYPA